LNKFQKSDNVIKVARDMTDISADCSTVV